MIKKLLKSSLVLLIATLISKLVIFTIGVLSARLLTQEEYGIFATIRNSVTSTGAILSGSFAVNTTRSVAELSDKNSTDDRNDIITSALIINILFFIVILFVVYFFSDEIVLITSKYSDNAIDVILLAVVLVLFTNASIFLQAALTGMELYSYIAKSSLFISLITLPVAIISIINFDLIGAVFSITFYYVVNTSIRYAHLRIHYDYCFTKFNLPVMWLLIVSVVRNNLYLLGTAFVLNFTFWFSRIILIKAEFGLEKVAIYDVAFQVLSLMMLINVAVSSVALTKMSKQNGEKFRFYILLTSVKVSLLISTMIAFFVYQFSESIIYLFGEQYLSSISVLKILTLVFIAFSLATVLNRYMVSICKTNHILVATILSSVVFFIAIWINELDNSDDLALYLLLYYSVSVLYYITYISIKGKSHEGKN